MYNSQGMWSVSGLEHNMDSQQTENTRTETSASEADADRLPQQMQNFDILLTMHLSMILAINQLKAQILFYNKLIIFLYMFWALLRSSSGGQIVLYSIWYHHTL